MFFKCFSLFYNSTLIRRQYLFFRIKYSYLSILPDDNANIFAASLFISYCSFSSLIWSSVVMASFYVISKRFFLKHNLLSDARLQSFIKREYGFAMHFCKCSWNGNGSFAHGNLDHLVHAYFLEKLYSRKFITSWLLNTTMMRCWWCWCWRDSGSML